MPDFSIEAIAEDALLVRFGNAIDAALNARVHAATRALQRAQLAGVVDIAPAYATLLLRFDCSATALAAMRQSVTNAIAADVARSSGEYTEASNVIEIPVCYGGDCGADLVAVAAHAQLTPAEVVTLHTAPVYTVAMLGFAPGFPYLLGLEPRLHVPRRTDPRTRVPAGSIAIGGAQTGIYPSELPAGWHLIGRTPAVLFDAMREPPCLLVPGNRVRFRAIDEREFTTQQAAYGH